jgi:hypothetical protein
MSSMIIKQNSNLKPIIHYMGLRIGNTRLSHITFVVTDTIFYIGDVCYFNDHSITCKIQMAHSEKECSRLQQNQWKSLTNSLVKTFWNHLNLDPWSLCHEPLIWQTYTHDMTTLVSCSYINLPNLHVIKFTKLKLLASSISNASWTESTFDFRMLINICEALNGSFELTLKMKQGGLKIIRPINNNDNVQVINHRKTTPWKCLTIWKLHYTLKLKI